MNASLLVAMREMRQVLATRGFWVLLMVVPAAFAASIVASLLMAPQPTVAFTMVDATGRYAAAIEQRLELDHQRFVLRDLSSYAERWKLAPLAPNAPWARPGSWLVDSEVQRFVAGGGAAAAQRQFAGHIPSEAAPFKVPPHDYVRVPPPRDVPVDRGADAFGNAIPAALKGDVETAAGKRPLALAIYIPREFGTSAAAPARIWTNGRYNSGLINPVRDVLTAALRQQAMQAGGVSPAVATQIDALHAPLVITDPPAGTGRSIFVTRSLVPLALVYLLLITAFTTGSMMLQGVIEERSNKLIESVLACMRPMDLMRGKLIGLGAIGLIIAGVWSACAVGAAFAAPGFVADLLRPSLQAIEGPWIILAMLFYFVAGYLVLAMLFLAVGSLSDSMQDAQSYLMPIIMLVMIPIFIMMQAAMRSPDSMVTQVLSWIPLYTPYAMLARLGTGVSLIEAIGTGVLLVAFIALELIVLGRLFRASLLSTGQPLNLRAFARLMLREPD